jgi:hypothetical protein
LLHLKKFSPSSSGAPPTRSPITVPRGLGSSIGMIAVMCTSHKKDPGPNLAGVFLAVRGTSALERQFHIVTAIGPVKPP